MPLNAKQREFFDRRVAAGDDPHEVLKFLASKSLTQAKSEIQEELDKSPLSTKALDKPVGEFARDWYSKGGLAAIAGKGKTLLEMGGKAALSHGGGRAAAAAASKLPLPPMLKVPAVAVAGLAGEAIGQAGGEVGRQLIEGEPIDMERAKAEGKTTAIMGGLMLGGGAAASYFGGVKGKHIGAAITDPRNRLSKPTTEKWYGFGEDVIADTGARAALKTEGRRAMENVIAMSRAAGVRVNGLEMVKALKRSVSRSNLPTLKASDQRLLAMADDLEREIKTLDPSGFIDPGDFDRIFMRDFTRPKFDAANVPEWGPDFKGAHSQARDQIAEFFYKELGPEMGDAARQAHNTLNIREAVEYELMPKTGTPRPGRVGQKLRATLSETNIAGLDARKALEAYDAENGTTFSTRLSQLHTQEAFSPLGKVESQELAQMGMLNMKPRSLVSAMLVSTAKKLLQGGGLTKSGSAVRSLAADLLQEAKNRDNMGEVTP